MNDPKHACKDAESYLKAYRRIFEEMKRGMKCAELKDSISYNFIVQMIPHHMGAVRMSKNALDFYICSGLKPILSAIIASQEKGICQMKALLKKQGCVM